MYTYIQLFKKIRTIVTVFILGLLLTPTSVNAQFPTAAAYPFTASSKPFTYLTGGTPAVTANTASWDDTYAANIPIGFTFNFCNVPYTTVTGHTNGYMCFGTNTNVFLSASASALGTVGPCMMAGWHDAMGAVSGPSSITYQTTGTAPNRIFTLEFKQWGSFSFSVGYITYQYILYEGGPCELMYKQEVSGSFNSAAIGIGRNATDFQSLPNTSASPVPSTTVFNASLTATPATGQSYLWGQIPCTGTPTTSVAGPNLVCPNKPFGLGLSGLSIFSGFSYQWQTSANGSSYTNWTGTVSPTGDISDAISSPKWYKCTVTCIASGLSYTTPAHFVDIAPFYYCYCDGSKATTAAGIDIGNAKVVSYPGGDVLLNNGNPTPFLSNSTSNKNYTEFRFTVPPVPMYHDSSYLLSMTQINSTATFTAATGAIYIDYNRNGRFDTWERVLLEPTTQSPPTPGMVTDTFKVPDSAGYGLTGMRVILRNGSTAPDTCLSYTDGETEDYLVDLRYMPCKGKPNPGIITGDTSMCVDYDYLLTDTTYEKFRHGIDKLWQISADGIYWTNIANSQTKDTLGKKFTGQPLYYRTRFICTHTNDTAFTPVHRVNLKPTYKCYCYSQSTGGPKDTSDIGGFKIYNFSVTDGGAHLANPRAVRKRQDYTDLQPIEMLVDSIYSFYIFHTQPNEFHADAKVTVFMDFDNDHKYDIPDERVFTGFTNVGLHTIIKNVVIPNAAIVDVPTGMRVIINNNVAPSVPSDDACGTYTSGETEDYMLIFRRAFPNGVTDVNTMEGMQLFPNPSSDGKFTVTFRSGPVIKEVKLRVTNATGQLVMQQVYSHDGGRFLQQLDLGGAAKGVYFVEVDADGIKENKRVVIR